MPCKFLLVNVLRAAVCLLSLLAISAYGIDITYQYRGDHGVDFSELGAGSLSVGPFSDAREVRDPRQISAGVQAQAPLTDIITSAFEQAFVAGNAKLAAKENGQGDVKFNFSGELLELITEQEGGEIKLTLRVNAVLKNATTNKILWQNKLFSGVSVPQQQGIDGAMRAALDRLIEELMFDDYFLNELLS